MQGARSKLPDLHVNTQASFTLRTASLCFCVLHSAAGRTCTWGLGMHIWCRCVTYNLRLHLEKGGSGLQVKKEQKELDRAFGSGPQLVPGKGMTDPEGKRMVQPTRACTLTDMPTAQARTLSATAWQWLCSNCMGTAFFCHNICADIGTMCKQSIHIP